MMGLVGIVALSVADAADFRSPRIAALGGAGRAGPLLTDVVYLNPSFVPFIPTHGISVSYMPFTGGNLDTPWGPMAAYGHNWSFSAFDGTAEALFQAGVAFTKREDGNLIHVGISKSVLNRLGFGIGTKVILPSQANGAIWEGVLSMTGVVTGWFQASLNVDNLFESARHLGFRREVTLGTKFNIMSIVILYADPHWTPGITGSSAFGVEAGAEFPFFKDFFLRGGGFKNAMQAHLNRYGDGWGVGGGFMAPRLSLDYGATFTTSPLISTAHSFGVTVFF